MRRDEIEALRTAVGLVLAVSHGDLPAFTELSWKYDFDERQRPVVHMLAALAANEEAVADLEQFALYMAGRDE
jgi:hypothetical protein